MVFSTILVFSKYLIECILLVLLSYSNYLLRYHVWKPSSVYFRCMFIFSFLTINVLLKKRRDKERKVKGRGCWRKNREGNGEVGKGGFLALEKPSLFSPPRSVISPQSICPEARFLICRMGVKTFFSWCYVSKETYWVGQKVSSDFSIPPNGKTEPTFWSTQYICNHSAQTSWLAWGTKCLEIWRQRG